MSSSNESDNDEEDGINRFLFWNDWKPLNKSVTPADEELSIENQSLIGCWLPPEHFRKRLVKNYDITRTSVKNAKDVLPKCENILPTWGFRLQYYKSLALIEDDTVVWSIFNVSNFGTFKLWKNEYGNVAAFGEAEFENGVTDEKAVLVVTSEVLLRKLLGVSSVEWSALLEVLKVKNAVLKYDAFNTNTKKLTDPLEKLWGFLCKRRHFLPCLSIKMRRAGVKKLTQHLKILPKFVAQDISTSHGSEIV